MFDVCEYRYVNAEAGLILRTGPSTSYQKILTMDFVSQVLELSTSDDGKWSYVCYSMKYYGWCYNAYLAYYP